MRLSVFFCATVLGAGLLLPGWAAPAAAGALTAGVVPAQATRPSLYFLDGQPSSEQAINALNRRTIASVNVVKGADATRIFGAGAADGVMLVVTKRNVGSAALAEFNQRYDIRPVETPVPPARP